MINRPDHRPIADLSNHELQFYRKHINTILKFSKSIHKSISVLGKHGVFIRKINIHEEVRLPNYSTKVGFRSFMPIYTRENINTNYFDFSIILDFWKDEIGLMLMIPPEFQETKHEITN